MSRVGYRLVLNGLSARSDTMLALRPTVAVLPFANLSNDPELAFFADGVTEDIIAALSRFRTFAVVARGSSFAYRGRAVPLPKVARALGVRYLLNGSIRRDGHRLRIAAELSDEDGRLHWADCFKEERDGVFEIQDCITETVVGHAEPEITRTELERSRRKQPEHLDAYDHFLQGRTCFDHMDASAALYDRMVGHLDPAVDLDPSFPQALACAGWAHELRRTFGDARPPGIDDYAVASELCERALAQADSDAVVLAMAAVEVHNLKDDGEAALALVERAVGLNPHSAAVLDFTATIQRQRGRTGEAIQRFERCLHLSPHSPWSAMWMENIGCCHLYDGRYSEAVEWIRQALAMGASWDLALVYLTVAEALLGEMDAAQTTLERFLRVRPGATIRGVLERLPPRRTRGRGSDLDRGPAPRGSATEVRFSGRP